MLNRWKVSEAAQCADPLALRAYSSRLLGSDPSLVLHGGGNTSVKLVHSGEDVLWVKGSGSDLAQVTEKDFTPLRLAAVKALMEEEDLSNERMMAALAPCVLQPQSPKPSIETLLHAALPHRFVEHTHADAILAVTNTTNGKDIAARIFGELAPLVPFRHSGFELAKVSFEVFRRERTDRTIGLILLQHGVFAFGDSARAAYENMLHLVALAENYLREHNAWELPQAKSASRWTLEEIAELRRDVCLAAGFPLVARLHDDTETLAFARRTDLPSLLPEGPATPQHAVFIKRMPMIGRDVKRYADEYRAYARESGEDEGKAPDSAPRVVLDENFGALILGFGTDYLGITEDIFTHSRQIMTRANAHDCYRGLPPHAVLEAEIHYGGFERRILAKAEDRDSLRGYCIALAFADSALAAILTDVLSAKGAALVDVTQSPSAKAAVRRYGGVDAMVISPEHSGALDEFVPILKRAPFGGKLLCSGSSPTVSPNEAIVAEVAPDSEMIAEALVRSLRDHRRTT